MHLKQESTLYSLGIFHDGAGHHFAQILHKTRSIKKINNLQRTDNFTNYVYEVEKKDPSFFN